MIWPIPINYKAVKSQVQGSFLFAEREGVYDFPIEADDVVYFNNEYTSFFVTEYSLTDEERSQGKDYSVEQQTIQEMSENISQVTLLGFFNENSILRQNY